MDIKHNNKTFVIIPAYNEEKNISRVIDGAKEYTDNIIVVDDGSRDNTFQIAKTLNESAIVLRHKINLGKGAALKTGCEAAINLGAEKLVLMDADGQHDPNDIPKLVDKLEKENLDIVFGARQPNENMPTMMFLGNKILTKLINFFLNIKLTDTQTGFKALTSEAYKKLRWHSSDYSVETEMIVKAGKNNLRYGEVSIQTIYKDNYKGTTCIDGIKIFFNLIKWVI